MGINCLVALEREAWHNESLTLKIRFDSTFEVNFLGMSNSEGSKY